MRALFFRTILILLSVYPLTSYGIELNGAGRRIAAPVFAEWGTRFTEQYHAITVKYQEVNATEGVKRVESGAADFGETDIPLSKEELGKRGLAQFPYMLTAITPVVNLPGVADGQLKLNGKTLSDIFLGKITKWNDPAISAMNPNLSLPNQAILVAHRTADGTGTFTLRSYLAKVSPDWQAKMGESLDWPVGTAVDNVNAMGDYVKKTPYAIGYSEISYARKNQLAYVRLQNNSGAFVSPHMGSVEEAVRGVHWTPANGFYEDMTDQPGARSWPMSSASYIVIRKTSDRIEQRNALLNFLGWGLRAGDMDVTRLDFLPIKRTVLPQIRNSWNDSPLSLEGATVVSAAQVRELMEKGVPAIDARLATEYESEHIAKARSVPYGEKSAKTADFNPLVDSFDLSKLPTNKNADIVFYCNAGSCWKSYKAATAAIKAGYKKVFWLRGGLPEWKEKGYPTESL